LAARVAGEVLRADGLTYNDGWLTRAGGDGGLDFVGRLDVGSGGASTPMIVLGQAKCIKPQSSINAEQVARVVARLQRGWLGVYVTTGTFTRQAQIEVIDDRYPLIMISGGRLAAAVRRMAFANHGGDVGALLETTVQTYANSVTYRRPEEILNA
jgi:restriction endonuclease Mrr